MGYNHDNTKRRGDLFNDTGKWKYTVTLDYKGADYDHWDIWAETTTALRRATDHGTSGVRLREIPTGWTLVVLKPYSRYSHPITIKGQ